MKIHISNFSKKIIVVLFLSMTVGFVYAQPSIIQYPSSVFPSIALEDKGNGFLYQNSFNIQDIPSDSYFEGRVLRFHFYLPNNRKIKIDVDGMPETSFQCAFLSNSTQVISYQEYYCVYKTEQITPSAPWTYYYNFEIRYPMVVPNAVIPVRIEVTPM